MIQRVVLLSCIFGGTLAAPAWCRPLSAKTDAGVLTPPTAIVETAGRAPKNLPHPPQNPGDAETRRPRRMADAGANGYRRAVNVMTFSDLRALARISPWFVRAAGAAMAKYRSRQIALDDYRFVDINGDGKSEIAMIGRFSDGKKTRHYLSVYEISDTFEAILRYERIQNMRQVHPETYRQSLDFVRNDTRQTLPGLGFCEDWQIASWQYHECHEILMDPEWRPQVLAYRVETSEPRAHFRQLHSYDFRSDEARRAYWQIPDGAFMPALHRETRYAMMFATPDAALSGPSRLPLQTAARYGAKNTAIQYGARWNDSGLYLSFAVDDGDIIPPETCGAQMSLQHADHIELWLDLNPDLRIRRDQPQTWVNHFEETYRGTPFRHDIDPDIFAFAVTPDGCFTAIHPVNSHWENGIETRAEKTALGYRVDIFIPSTFYRIDNMRALAPYASISLTARQHDIHADNRFCAVATSEWQWADPFTLGQLWILPDERAPLPFPIRGF